MSSSAWSKKTLCLVTGASQGIGREIAKQFAANVAPGSTLILTARSEAGLHETAASISQANPDITLKIFPYDMSKPNAADFSSMFQEYKTTDWEQYLLVHNAGSEGSGRLIKECSDAGEWNTYMSLNLYSVAALTSAFLAVFHQHDRIIIVNITSLAGIQAFAGLGEYSINKASREMYMKVLAAENPTLKLLNYSPGPVSTEMVSRCISKIGFQETRGMFEKMQSEQTLVKPEDTVAKLVKLIRSGLPPLSRVDYFDRD